MNVSIFGLGYVGTVCAACFTELGHQIIGVDKSIAKVDLIRRGRSPVVEPGISDKVARAVATGQLTATTDATEAIVNSDISMVCVGTPSSGNGNLDLTAIREVAVEIGRGLRAKNAPHTVTIRSTVLPGTTRGTVGPLIEEASGNKIGRDFDLAFNPEFLREGSAIADFNAPSEDRGRRLQPEHRRPRHGALQGSAGRQDHPAGRDCRAGHHVDNSCACVEGELCQRDRQHREDAPASTAATS